VCEGAVQLINTGNRRLANVTVSGDASCQMPPDVLLEPKQGYNCTVGRYYRRSVILCSHTASMSPGNRLGLHGWWGCWRVFRHSKHTYRLDFISRRQKGLHAYQFLVCNKQWSCSLSCMVPSAVTGLPVKLQSIRVHNLCCYTCLVGLPARQPV